MKKHLIEFPQGWDLEEENLKLYIKSVIIALYVERPVIIEAILSSGTHTFIIYE